jgi:hypothetical protein
MGGVASGAPRVGGEAPRGAEVSRQRLPGSSIWVRRFNSYPNIPWDLWDTAVQKGSILVTAAPCLAPRRASDTGGDAEQHEHETQIPLGRSNFFSH